MAPKGENPQNGETPVKATCGLRSKRNLPQKEALQKANPQEIKPRFRRPANKEGPQSGKSSQESLNA